MHTRHGTPGTTPGATPLHPGASSSSSQRRKDEKVQKWEKYIPAIYGEHGMKAGWTYFFYRSIPYNLYLDKIGLSYTRSYKNSQKNS
ncbi:hypothetical protein P8C59_009170 [Phyllachora maydis]|uniref:Uncharacterized protein n=1 Tax=Phyllachora maydis TaxID=1825666 RepID=A0AAD9IE45_9PEZI|nr:hypothetical protein P8C59_009170 [Phyllachora maydis]